LCNKYIIHPQQAGKCGATRVQQAGRYCSELYSTNHLPVYSCSEENWAEQLMELDSETNYPNNDS